MNLELMKKRLEELQKKSGGGSKKSNSDILWRPVAGDQIVRIVPLKKNPDDPFQELYFHYLGGNTYLSPISYGEDDPIQEFGEQLRKEVFESGERMSQEEWNETKNFFPKKRTFAPIIVRGEEEKGVRYWAFGKTVFTDLQTHINNEEYGDISNITTGTDILVKFTPGQKAQPDNKVSATLPETHISMKRNSSPLTTDKELLKKWLTNQPDLLASYERYSYDDLKMILENYLNPKNVSSKKVNVGEDGWATESPTANKSMKNESAAVATAASEFDSLFNK